MPSYFISIDDDNIESNWDSDESEKKIFKTKALKLKQTSKSFNINNTLQLLEYSIKNIPSIETSQSNILYNQNHYNITVKSIDTNIINDVLHKSKSDLLTNILKNRVEREDSEFDYGVSYFWQDNKYNIFQRYESKIDTTLLRLDNIYQFSTIDDYTTIVFENDSTFFFISQINKKIVSKRHTIHNVHNYYKPFRVIKLSNNLFSIYYNIFIKGKGLNYKEMVLIYSIDKDNLIQDLDKIFE